MKDTTKFLRLGALAAYDGNFRPVQALNGREVDVDTSK